eukprot:Clim_evm194s157 gene=Clim_evmTU194s157
MPPKSKKKGTPKKGKKEPKMKMIKKDKNAPKRAMSAFMFFGNDIRPQLRQEYPDAKITQIAAILGQRWKALPQKDRVKYEKMAAADKERYQQEKAHYVPPPNLKKGKRKKDPNAPKRAMSAFMYYANDVRAVLRQKHPDLKITQIAQMIGEQWQNMNEKQRKTYVEKAAADKARYDKERAAYVKSK